MLRVQEKNSQIPIIMISRLSSENCTLNLENQDAVAQWRARIVQGGLYDGVSKNSFIHILLPECKTIVVLQ